MWWKGLLTVIFQTSHDLAKDKKVTLQGAQPLDIVDPSNEEEAILFLEPAKKTGCRKLGLPSPVKQSQNKYIQAHWANMNAFVFSMAWGTSTAGLSWRSSCEAVMIYNQIQKCDRCKSPPPWQNAHRWIHALPAKQRGWPECGLPSWAKQVSTKTAKHILKNYGLLCPQQVCHSKHLHVHVMEGPPGSHLPNQSWFSKGEKGYIARCPTLDPPASCKRDWQKMCFAFSQLQGSTPWIHACDIMRLCP